MGISQAKRSKTVAKSSGQSCIKNYTVVLKEVYRITATAEEKVAFSGQKSALFLGDC